MDKEKRIIELFLVLIFVTLLLIAVLLVLNSPQNQKSATSNVVSNSYNTVSYNSYIQKPSPLPYKPDYKKIYLKEDNYLDYSSYGKYKKTKDFIGSYINEFDVYVKNQDYKGGYFKVRFYFEDYDGKEFTELITHHIPAGEEKRFFYRDIEFEKNKYRNWKYEVISETKKPKQEQDYKIIYVYK